MIDPAVFTALGQKTPRTSFYVASALSVSLIIWRLLRLSKRRTRTVFVRGERVLILGATSGVGCTLAHQYASRGARVCIVGRREQKVREVRQQCARLAAQNGSLVEGAVLGVSGDCTNATDMVKVRETLEKAWSGLDTMIFTAGVSALQPLMAVAGVEMSTPDIVGSQASPEGIQHAMNAATAAVNGNFTGPYVAAVTFIPLLSYTSTSPSILLLSSAAAVLPAPTRSLYSATKSASLLLYQALAIEHPSINFSFIMPGTIEGNFRASAVDNPLDSSGPQKLHEADPNKHGLKRKVVATRCIEAIDNKERTVFLPLYFRLGHILYWFCPAFVEWRARIKYNFK